MTLASPALAQLQRQGAVTHVTPARRAFSVRRTISTDVRYPEGETGSLRLEGHARDLLTRESVAPPQILAQEKLLTHLQADRTILSLSATPDVAGLAQLLGCNTFRRFRAELHARLDMDALRTRPMMVLLDDLVGLGVIAGWTWIKWPYARTPGQTASEGHPPSDSCIGYRVGSAILQPDYDQWDTIRISLLPEGYGDDVWAFHDFPADDATQPCLRRVRRMDVWEDDAIRAEMILQDSTNLPDGDRACMHEFALQAVIDPVDLTVREISAQGRAVPHENCFDGPATAQALVGMNIREARAKVLSQLRGAAGCTHLNDMMRMLSEIDVLIGQLRAAL